MKGWQLTWQTRTGPLRLVVAPDEVAAVLLTIFRTWSDHIQVVIEELD